MKRKKIYYKKALKIFTAGYTGYQILDIFKFFVSDG